MPWDIYSAAEISTFGLESFMLLQSINIKELSEHFISYLYLLICLVSSDDDCDDLSKPTFETKSATKIPSSSLKSPALNIAQSYDNYIDVLDDWIDIDDDENPDYLAAIEASLKHQNSQNNGT